VPLLKQASFGPGQPLFAWSFTAHDLDMTFHYYHLVSYNLNLFCLPFILYIYFSSHLVSSRHISSHHVSSCLSSCLISSQGILSDHFSSCLTISHHVSSQCISLITSLKSHPISSLSYHFSPSHTSSAIIFHISRHPASSTQWKPAALLHGFCPPPGLKSSCRHFSTLPLFLFLNFKTRSTRCDAKSIAL